MTLALDRISVSYGARTAVEPLSLELHTGNLVALVGPNGAGKSSLIKALAGVLPHHGAACWNGKDVTRLPSLERARTIAYLPQTPTAHWPVSAGEIVALGRLPHRAFAAGPNTNDDAAVTRALERCDAASFASRGIDELSGGERARVLLARALAVEAPVLLVDEPIHSLDPYHQLQIMNVLRQYAAPDTVVMVVLHDLALAARFCTRMILMHEGKVVADGEPRAVLTTSTLERYYRVNPFLATHEGEPVILPWRRLDRLR